jgi:hypothetical protein
MLQGHRTESSGSRRNSGKNNSAVDDLWLFDGAATEMGVFAQADHTLEFNQRQAFAS